MSRFVIPGEEPDYDEDDESFAGNYFDVLLVNAGASPFISVNVGNEYDERQDGGYFDAATARIFAAELIAAAERMDATAPQEEK